jgi:CheY-like chemotaxis protein
MMREVLRLRRAEQLLRADNEELAVARDDYAELYDLAPLPLLTLGAHATIRSANLATAELFERERTWLLGRSFRLLFHALDRATVTSCLNAPGTSNSCTARLILPDDSLAFTGISRRFSLRRAGILHVALQDLRQQLGAAPTAAAARRLLLVEDDLETSEAMQEMLERNGYGVVSADSVGSAVNVDLEGVDAIVSDIRLPDGLGTDLVRQLKRERDVPAIAFSGLASSSDVERAKQAGFDLFLSKPVDFTRLLTELATLLETRTARTAAPTP